MAHVSQVQQLIKKDSRPIHYLTCKDSIGRDCYFFIMTTLNKVGDLMHELKDNGEVDLNDFGHIVASGFGREPSEAVVATLKKHFNIDPELMVKESFGS